MADMFDVQSKRGSIWHRWDPHIHTPGEDQWGQINARSMGSESLILSHNRRSLGPNLEESPWPVCPGLICPVAPST